MIVEVEWDGLPAVDERTWEPVETIFEDLPGMLEEFISTPGNRQLKTKVRTLFFT